MLEIIKEIASIVSALAIIITTFIAINKWTKGKILNWLQKPVLDKLEEHAKSINELKLNDLKLIIMNDNIPLSERVEAGERYIVLGGNGAIHAHYDVLIEEYKKQLKRGDKIERENR